MSVCSAMIVVILSPISATESDCSGIGRDMSVSTDASTWSSTALIRPAWWRNGAARARATHLHPRRRYEATSPRRPGGKALQRCIADSLNRRDMIVVVARLE